MVCLIDIPASGTVCCECSPSSRFSAVPPVKVTLDATLSPTRSYPAAAEIYKENGRFLEPQTVSSPGLSISL